MNAEMLAQLDAAFEAEIPRVSTLEFNSNSICRTFYEHLRKRLVEEISLTEPQPASLKPLSLKMPTLAYFANDIEAEVTASFLTASSPFEGDCWGDIQWRYVGFDASAGGGAYALFHKPETAEDVSDIEVFINNLGLVIDHELDDQIQNPYENYPFRHRG